MKTINHKIFNLPAIRKILLFPFFIFINLIAYSQSPAIVWQKSYGGSEWDAADCIIQTLDGGFIIAGMTESNNYDVSGNHGDSDYWIVKIDSIGNIDWKNCYGGSDYDEAKSIIQTNDDGYIVAGYTYSGDGDVSNNHGKYDFWIVKLNSTGDTLWTKCYGGSSSDKAYSIIQTNDGDYLIAGVTYSNDGDVEGNHYIGSMITGDFWIVRIDNIGNIIWQKCLGGSLTEEANSINRTSDGGFIVAGAARSDDGDVPSNYGSDDWWIVKLNYLGDTVWTKCYGGSNSESLCTILQTYDGGYIAAGSSYSDDGDVSSNLGESDYWIVKLDSIGNIQWQKSFGGSYYDFAHSILQSINGEYLVAGGSESVNGDITSNKGSGDYWVIKLNSLGNIKWRKSLGGSNWESAKSIIQTNDTGFLVTGSSRSNDGDVSGNHGNYDFWSVKLETEDSIVWPTCGDSIVDARDGRKYATVKVGDKCWMCMNLEYQEVDTFNYSDTICPEDWHLPYKSEWSILNEVYEIGHLVPEGESGLNFNYLDEYWTFDKVNGPSHYTEGNTTYYCYNNVGLPASCWVTLTYTFLNSTIDSLDFVDFKIYRNDDFIIDYSDYYYNARCVSNSFFSLDTFEINVDINIPGSGTVTGTGDYLFGEEVNLIANPGEGYSFLNWQEEGSIVSMEASYTFIAYRDRIITVSFQLQPVPATPTLVSPSNQEESQPTNIIMYWNSAEEAETYYLQVATESDFSILTFNDSTITDTLKQIGSLDILTTYYWRVRAKNTVGISPWSEVWSFTTSNSVQINELFYDIRYKLYPNPVFNELYIEGVQEEIINISIFSFDGKLLKQIHGKGIKQIDISDLQNGIYIIEIVNPKIMVIKKIVKQ